MFHTHCTSRYTLSAPHSLSHCTWNCLSLGWAFSHLSLLFSPGCLFISQFVLASDCVSLSHTLGPLVRLGLSLSISLHLLLHLIHFLPPLSVTYISATLCCIIHTSLIFFADAPPLHSLSRSFWASRLISLLISSPFVFCLQTGSPLSTPRCVLPAPPARCDALSLLPAASWFSSLSLGLRSGSSVKAYVSLRAAWFHASLAFCTDFPHGLMDIPHTAHVLQGCHCLSLSLLSLIYTPFLSPLISHVPLPRVVVHTSLLPLHWVTSHHYHTADALHCRYFEQAAQPRVLHYRICTPHASATHIYLSVACRVTPVSLSAALWPFFFTPYLSHLSKLRGHIQGILSHAGGHHYSRPPLLPLTILFLWKETG